MVMMSISFACLCVPGQSTIIPVTGWFCKLCNKFYNNESAAKDAHCKTETHFGKYKVLFCLGQECGMKTFVVKPGL